MEELSDKIDKLVKFLNICPQCLSGKLDSSKYSSWNGHAVFNVTDTWNKDVKHACSNKMCNYTTVQPNPNYKEPKNAHGFTEKSDDEGLETLEFEF